jgi:hypothetical protein
VNSAFYILSPASLEHPEHTGKFRKSKLYRFLSMIFSFFKPLCGEILFFRPKRYNLFISHPDISGWISYDLPPELIWNSVTLSVNMPLGPKMIRWMDPVAAGHFKQYTAKRKTVTFTKICPAMKNQQ